MDAILLSGAGGNSNWLPLIMPIAALAFVLLTADLVVKAIKKRKLEDKIRSANHHGINDTTRDHS
ncbi:MAG: hypothetical protein V4649_13600 [Bacteroidota bacterium]